MSFKWQNVHMPLFLKHFKRYDCLWNNESHSYKDRFARTKALKAMRSDLNLDGVSERDIKLKIKTIRTKYASEAAKIRRSTECGGSRVYKPRVFWFDQADDFLKGNCIPRSSTANLHVIKIEGSLETDEDNTDDGVSNEQSGTSGDNRNADDDVELKVKKATHVDIEQSRGSRFPAARRGKQRNIQALRRKKRRNDIPIDRVDEDKEDEFDLFCRSLAVQLKKMPIQRALICQEKLQSVMVQERLTLLDSLNFSASPKPETYYVDQSREYVYTASPPSQS